MTSFVALLNLSMGAALLTQLLLTLHAYFRRPVATALAAGIFLGSCCQPQACRGWLDALLPHFPIYLDTTAIATEVLAANFLYFCVWSGYLGFCRSLVESARTP